jgi:hypothetical protein
MSKGIFAFSCDEEEGYLMVEETQVDGYLSVGDISGQTIWH